MLTERRLLDYQKAEGFKIQGLIGHEVLNFKRFSYRILSTYGGDAAEPLCECGKIMMLTSALENLSGKLKYFSGLFERPGEIARLLSLWKSLANTTLPGSCWAVWKREMFIWTASSEISD